MQQVSPVMTNLAQNELHAARRNFRSESSVADRGRPLTALFIHRDADVVDSCLEELKKAQFIVHSDSVLTLAQCTQQLRTEPYDVVIVEYPSPNWKGSQALQLLHQTAQEVPLLFVTTALGSESIAQLTADGAFDYVEREHLAQLSMAVRRVLNERNLRAELEEAGRALRHSQSLYRALVENPAYGICRCDAGGKFLDVNQALLARRGYESKEELLVANRASKVALDLGLGAPLAGSSPEPLRIEPVEIEWRRKNSTSLKGTLSGRGIFDDHGNFVGYEIIAVDVTEQRSLEDHLPPQPLCASLPELATYRRLFS